MKTISYCFFLLYRHPFLLLKCTAYRAFTIFVRLRIVESSFIPNFRRDFSVATCFSVAMVIAIVIYLLKKLN